MRLLLVGNYGAENLGDELLKEYFLKAFPAIAWVVVSANPAFGEVPRLPCGIRSLLSTPWWRTLRELRRSQGMVFGGGALFTDTESVKAPLLWFIHAFAVWCFGKPIYLAFQGIGPFYTMVGEWCARWVTSRAQFLSVRDEASTARVRAWNLNKKIVQSFDPVISLVNGNRTRSDSCLQNLLIIIPRGNSGSEFIACAEKLAADFSQVKILLFGKNASDRVQGERLKHLLRIPSEVKTVDTLETLVSQLHEASCVLSQRYHGALIAFALRKPLHIVLQGRGDKFSALIPLVETATPEALRTLVQRGEQAFRETLLTLRK